MKYEDLLLAIEEDDEAVMRAYLQSHVIEPCLSGHPDCNTQHHIDDLLATPPGFVKPNLLEIYSFAVFRLTDAVYEVHVRAQYVDTLSALKDGRFAKTRVVVSIDGDVSPEGSIFSCEVYTKPIEKV